MEPIKTTSRWRWLAPLLGLTAACRGGNEAAPLDVPWDGATALSAREDSPSGIAVVGGDVLYTTGLTQVGDQAVRIAPLAPAVPAASRILVAHPGGEVPNGPIAVERGQAYVAAGNGIVRVTVATGAVAPVVDRRPASVSSVAVDDRFIWWTTSSYQAFRSGEVARIPKEGGPVEILAAAVDDQGRVYEDDPARQAVGVPGTSYFDSIVLEGTGALVATPAAVLRVAGGTRPAVVVDSKALGGPPSRIVAAAGRVYGVVAGPRENLFSVPLGGGPVTKLGAGADDTKGLALAGDELVFVATGGSGGRATIKAVPQKGGPDRPVSSGRYAGGDLVTTDDHVVFSADGRVWSVPLRRT